MTVTDTTETFTFTFTRDMPRVLHLECDVGVEIPMFPQYQAVEDMLPADLRQRMMKWQEFFDHNWHWDRGWKSHEAETEHIQEGEALLPLVQEVFRGKAEVVLGYPTR